MPRRPRSEEISEWIKSQIQDGTWPLNSRIPTEVELSESLGVGRSTIREATKVMVNNGMLESAPGRGTFVRSRNAINVVLRDYLEQQPVMDVVGLRRALEVEASGLAAANCSEEDLARLRKSASGDRPDLRPAPASPGNPQSPGSFHADVFRAAGNPLLTEMFESVIAVLWRGKLVPGPKSERDADHARLLEAITEGDVQGAREAAAFHVDRDFRLPD
ncbi:FadR/GntR family transcriptional regulator [Lentzea sp. NPDC058450]|uniref:FadR/GntR family transcriptional regulator n=1 Tax=Lentzea sp. NPDC058450 TaxID=3346505 RepID=UPI00364BB97E